MNRSIFYECRSNPVLCGPELGLARNYAEDYSLRYALENHWGRCGAETLWAVANDGTLVITGEGAMNDYEWNEVPWRDLRGDITAVEMGHRVTEIGAFAFAGCERVTEVPMPEDLTRIGNAAFRLCKGLTFVWVPDGVSYLGSRLFEGCESLAAAVLPENLESVGKYAFKDCASLTELTLPANVTRIGSAAFSGCTALERLEIPAATTEIGEDALADTGENLVVHGNYGSAAERYAYDNGIAFVLRDAPVVIQLPGNLRVIEAFAFTSCDGITDVHVPADVEEVGPSAFANCPDLKRVTFFGSDTVISDDAFAGCCMGLTLYGNPGSTAEAFALAHGIHFQPIA